MMTLPGCGSAWKKPSSKIILMMIDVASLAIDLPFAPSATARSSFLPSKNSSVSTCLLDTLR